MNLFIKKISIGMILLLSLVSCFSKKNNESITIKTQQDPDFLFKSNECGCKSFLIGDDGLVLSVKDPFNIGFEEFNDLLSENEYFLGLYDLDDQKTITNLHEILKNTINSPQYLSQLRNSSKGRLVKDFIKEKLNENKSTILNLAGKKGFDLLLTQLNKKFEIDEKMIEIAKESFSLKPTAFIQNFTSNMQAYLEEHKTDDELAPHIISFQNIPSNADLSKIVTQYFESNTEKQQSPSEIFIQNSIDFSLSHFLGNSLVSEIFNESYRHEPKEFARTLLGNTLNELSSQIKSSEVEVIFGLLSRDFLNKKIELDSLLLESGFNILLPKIIGNEVIAEILSQSFSKDPKQFLNSASNLALNNLIENNKISGEFGVLIRSLLSQQPKNYVKEVFPHGAKYLASVIYNSLKSDKVKEGLSNLYNNDIVQFFANNDFQVSKDSLKEQVKKEAFEFAVQKVVHSEMISNVFKNVFHVDPNIVSRILHTSFDLDPKKLGLNVLTYSGKEFMNSFIKKQFPTFSPLQATDLAKSFLKSPQQAFKSLLGPETLSALGVSLTVMYVKFLVKHAISLIKEKNCLHESTSARGEIGWMCTVSWNQKEKMKEYARQPPNSGQFLT